MHQYKVAAFLPDYVTFGYLPSQFRLSDHLSVCNVCAPYSDCGNFWQCFYAILYSSHWLTLQNFMEISPGEPLRRGLNARGVAKYSDVGHFEGYISETVQDTIQPREQLLTNSKSYL